jgi:hypothetical protein
LILRIKRIRGIQNSPAQQTGPDSPQGFARPGRTAARPGVTTPPQEATKERAWVLLKILIKKHGPEVQRFFLHMIFNNFNY